MKLITKPTQLPIDLETAKTHLRVDHTDEDTVIEALIGAAVDWVQKFTGLALVVQTWELRLDEFPENELQIKKAPLLDVVVVYDDGSGSEVTLDVSAYEVDARDDQPSWLLPASSWPTTFDGVNAVRVRVRVGFIDPSDSPPDELPPAITAAMLMYLQVLYERGAMDPIKQEAMMKTAEMLLRQYRIELSLA